MKGKAIFTKGEANAIIALIRGKLLADSNEQKRIRDKIRAKGFYASDFGIGSGYNEQDFLRVVKIVGGTIIPVVILKKSKSLPVAIKQITGKSKRSNSDEEYIIDLCDKVLKLRAYRQHRFDFLRGDSGTLLPVDAFYPTISLAIEYCEKQHTEEVKLFDKRQTVSGVNRGKQRKIYDQRRRDLLPKNNIKLIELGYDEFEHSKPKRLLRNSEKDMLIIRKKLKLFIKK
ncbi:MAG TPA: hypothetical protein VK498_05730 [Ferruginibacter sp.]|nr:hypothetical protein [Ferruginibacter sp.]